MLQKILTGLFLVAFSIKSYAVKASEAEEKGKSEQTLHLVLRLQPGQAPGGLQAGREAEEGSSVATQSIPSAPSGITAQLGTIVDASGPAAAPSLTEWSSLTYDNMNRPYREAYGVDLIDGCGVHAGKPYPLQQIQGRPNSLCEALDKLCGGSRRSYQPAQIHSHVAVDIAEQCNLLSLEGRDPGDAGRQLRHMAATAERQGAGRDAFRDLMRRNGWPVREKDSRQGFKKKTILDF